MLPLIKKKSKGSSHLEVSQDASEEHTMDIVPPIGRTSRPIYWSVVLTSVLVLAIMVTAIARGGMAVAAAVSVPIRASFGTLVLTNTSIHVSIADTGQVVFIRSNVIATNVVQIVTVELPGLGPVTVKTTIARLVIRGLVNKAAFPGSVTPGLPTPAFNDVDFLWDSATFEGLTITVIRGR